LLTRFRSSSMHEKIWNNCLKLISEQVSEQSFKTWFQPIVPIRLKEKVLTIQVPSQFFYEWLEEHYVSLLKETISSEVGEEGRLEYSVIVDQGAENEKPYSINLPGNRTTIQAESVSNGELVM